MIGHHIYLPGAFDGAGLEPVQDVLRGDPLTIVCIRLSQKLIILFLKAVGLEMDIIHPDRVLPDLNVGVNAEVIGGLIKKYFALSFLYFFYLLEARTWVDQLACEIKRIRRQIYKRYFETAISV